MSESTVRLDESGRFIRVVVLGGLTPEGFDDLLGQIAALPGDAPRLPALWDVRNLDFGHTSSQDVRSMVRVRARHPARHAARAAILVGSEVGFGMMRMFQIQQDADRIADETLVGIFYTEEDAVAWLRE